MPQQEAGHRMKVFISWSGERSKALAQALHDWIPMVLHYVDPWVSAKDIEAGERWADNIAKELEASNFGIICVTRENVAIPWVIFEAGALAKSMSGRVIPLLLDLEFKDITGPLAQFQAKKVEPNGLYEVIASINEAANLVVPAERARKLAEALWSDLEKRVEAIPKQAQAAKPARPQHEVLEELVGSVRALDNRLREVAEETPRSWRSRRRFHPSMLMEMGHMLSEGPGDPVQILVLASFLRDDVPWLYELGVDAYRAARAGRIEEVQLTVRRFQRAVKNLMRGPFMEEMRMDPMLLDMLTHEIGRFAGPDAAEEDETHTAVKRQPRRKPEQE